MRLTPPSFGHLPYILRCKTPRNTTGHGREEGDSNPPFKQSSPFFLRLPCDFAAPIKAELGFVLLLVF